MRARNILTAISTLLAMVALTVFAAACTTAAAAPAQQAQAPFDQQFIDMMVPHHQGAVAMAKIAQQRGQHAEIRDMADAIIRSQNSEIQQMKAWREEWYGSDQTPPMSQMPMVPGMEGHGAHGATMDMAADVERLREAGEPFDRAFIDAMIPHHESAVAAARIAQQRAEHQEIRELAGAIIRDQEREIAQLRQWRETWYGNPTPSTDHGAM